MFRTDGPREEIVTSKEIGIATPVVTVFAITVMAALVSQSSANRAPAYAHYVLHYTRCGVNHHKLWFEVDGDYILGFTTFGVGAAEIMPSVQIAINAGLRYHDTARRYPQSLHIVGNTKKTARLFTKRTMISRDSAESRIEMFH